MAASRQEIIFKKVIHKLSDGVEKNTKLLGSIYSMLLYCHVGKFENFRKCGPVY